MMLSQSMTKNVILGNNIQEKYHQSFIPGLSKVIYKINRNYDLTDLKLHTKEETNA